MKKFQIHKRFSCSNSKQTIGRYLASVGLLSVLSQPLLAAEPAKCLPLDNWFPHARTPRPNDATFESNSNCVFHQWSWQMFLWLTQELNGKPRFLSFASPQSLIGMQQRGFFPRMSQSQTPESFDEFLQAGTDGIMVDQQGHAIYYSQYVNPVFADFIHSHGLTDPAKVRAMDPNTTFPIVAEQGAMELKVSWKRVAPGEDVSDMFFGFSYPFRD